MSVPNIRLPATAEVLGFRRAAPVRFAAGPERMRSASPAVDW